MTDIPSITDSVSLQELIRSSASPRDRSRNNGFVQDPAEEATRSRNLEEIVEESRENRRQEQSASRTFVERAAQSANADEVTQLVESLSELNIDPPPPSLEPERAPGVDIDTAGFQGVPTLDDANEEARERRDQLTGSVQERFVEQNRNIISQNQVRQNFENTAFARNEDARVVQEDIADIGDAVARTESDIDSRESANSFRRSRGELADLAVRNQDGQSRLAALEESIGSLVADNNVDGFVESTSGNSLRTSQADAIFGAQQIEEAISSNQATNALRLLDEQQAAALLNRGTANAVVVGSDVVEDVNADGRVTQVRLEQDAALRTPGTDLFFNNDLDRDLGNILNGVE